VNAKSSTLLSFITVLSIGLSGAMTTPVGAGQAPQDPVASIGSSEQAKDTASAPSGGVMFIENVGQFGDGARFQVRGGNGTIWLADDAVWVTVLEKLASSEPPSPSLGEEGVSRRFHARGEAGDEGNPRNGVNLKLSFVGANPHPSLEPFNRLDTHVSYFIGDDPAGWRADVPVWGGVRYRELYPGMDLEIADENGGVVQRLVVGEGADLDAVRLRVDGEDEVALDGGLLRLRTAAGEYTLPLLQVSGAGSAELPPPAVAGDEITSPFGHPQRQAAPADPQASESDLLYATMLGGGQIGLEDGHGIAIDASGAAYVTGETRSSDFPTTVGAFDTTYNGGASDAFVVKLNAAGSALTYATFLGGSSDDEGWGIAIDASGAAYVTGWTQSSDFPTTGGAFDPSFNGYYDAFVAKLNAPGSGLTYATFLGGISYDYGYNIAIDASGAAYVTGYTGPADFPTTPGALDTSYNGDGDAFVVKLNTAGSALTYGTFLGGSNDDAGWGIAVDMSGEAYVTGNTESSDFPTTAGAFDTSRNGSWDAFVVKLNGAGSALAYATFLGGNSGEAGDDIAIDASGAYVAGLTSSSDFLTTPGAFDTTFNGGIDGFVVKLDATGSALTYATYLGGSNDDYGPDSIAIDASGAVHVTGWTWSSDFPTTDGAFDTTSNGGGYDVFVVTLNAAGSALTYATFLGGNSGDEGDDIAIDASGATYVTGYTFSSDFPTTAGAFDTSLNGIDAFVVKLAVGGVSAVKVYLPLVMRH
jgi:hypothetical protein